MNSAWMASFDTPTGKSGFWEKSTRTLEHALGDNDDRIKKIAVPKDDRRTPADERKQNLRPGDVLVWGATQPGGYGHQMIIVEKGSKGGEVIVRQAGATVHEAESEPIDAADREEAVYRFAKYDQARVAQNLAQDPAYRLRFLEAFERSSLRPLRTTVSPRPHGSRSVVATRLAPAFGAEKIAGAKAARSLSNA